MHKDHFHFIIQNLKVSKIKNHKQHLIQSDKRILIIYYLIKNKTIIQFSHNQQKIILI